MAYILMTEDGFYISSYEAKSHGGKKTKLETTTDIHQATLFLEPINLVINSTFNRDNLIKLEAKEIRRIKLLPMSETEK